MMKIDHLMRSGREPQVFLKELGSHCRALLTVKAVQKDAASILDVTEEDEERYRVQSDSFSEARLLKMLDLFMRAESELKFASTPRIGLESAVLHSCEQNAGEDTSALLERIGELEAKLNAIQADIKSGRLKAVPAEKNTEKQVTVPAESSANTASKPEPPPAPSDEKAIWERALDELKKNDPPVFALLKKERFIGAKGNVYRVLIPMAKKEFSYVRLNQQPRKERISKALSDVSGQQLIFEAVLDSDAGDERLEAVRADAQNSLIEAFGRDMVQIDEGKKQ